MFRYLLIGLVLFFLFQFLNKILKPKPHKYSNRKSKYSNDIRVFDNSKNNLDINTNNAETIPFEEPNENK